MKILIVDDELPIREWIKFVIEQLGDNYQVVGMAANGEEALQLYRRERPDVIFADLLMPVMDGMALIEAVRQLDSAVEIVVLTSHDVFAYARHVMRHGINQYILKTEINKEQLRCILLEIQKRIEAKKALHNPRPDFVSMERSAYFRRLVEQPEAEAPCSKRMDEYGIPLQDSPLFALAFQPEAGWDTYSFQLPEDEAIQNAVGFVYDRNVNMLLCNIVVVPSFFMQNYRLNSYIQRIAALNRFRIGVSHIHRGWAQIRTAILEARLQLEMTFYGQVTPLPTTGIDEILHRHRELERTLEAEKRAAIQRMELKHSDGAQAEVEQFLERLRQLRPASSDFVKQQLISLLNSLFQRAAPPAGLSAVLEEVRRADSFAQVSDCVLGYVRDLLEQDVTAGQRYNRAVAQVIDYVRQNYHEPISLELAAELVHLNPDYLSRLFKKATGMTFVAYLTSVRLTRAAELLKTTDQKVYEIAEAVGYSNIGYFSGLFKRRYGVNPFEYRNSGEVGIGTEMSK